MEHIFKPVFDLSDGLSDLLW